MRRAWGCARRIGISANAAATPAWRASNWPIAIGCLADLTPYLPGARLIDLFLDEFPGLGKLIATQRNFRKLPWKARASRLDGVW
jgi:hypothetical protein